jgi:hypothetical protein
MVMYDDNATKKLTFDLLKALDVTTAEYEASFDGKLDDQVTNTIWICIGFLSALICLYVLYYHWKIRSL